MDDAKAQTRTVSMPKSLWDAVDNHAKEAGEDRSSYLRRLASADLSAAGKLPGSRRAEAHARLDELMAAEGEDVALARITGGASASLAGEAGGRGL